MSQAWRSPFLSVRLSEKATTAPLSEWSGLEQGDGSSPLFGRIRFVPGGSGSDPVGGPNFCALNG